MNGFGLKTLRTLVLGSIFVALFQSEKYNIFPLKSLEMVSSGGIINISTVSITPAKGRSEVRFNLCEMWTNILNGFGLKTLYILVLGSIHVALFQSDNFYIVFSKIPETVSPGGTINSSITPNTPAKDKSKARS